MLTETHISVSFSPPRHGNLRGYSSDLSEIASWAMQYYWTDFKTGFDFQTQSKRRLSHWWQEQFCLNIYMSLFALNLRVINLNWQ